MKQKVPTSPFATRLSGFAKETELRLRNIFQWKKKRPPVVLLILAALIALLCGGLVSCQPEQELSDEQRAEQENVTVDSALDNGMIPKHTAESPELMAKFGQDKLFPSKIQVLFLPWETKVWKPMERLSQEQKDLLADLPVDELPRQAAELGSLFRENIWRDTLIPLAADEENDVTLYGVVGAASVPNIGSRVSVSSQALFVDGIVLRHGDRAVYEPLSWEANAWYGTNPWVSVRDFDGDGNTEAAVCLYAGHGTGVSVKNLYFFDLDTLIYTVPDYSAFGEIEVEHDPTAHTLTLTVGTEILTVDVPADLEPDLREGECGNIVRFQEEDGRIDCWGGLDFHGTAAYLAYAAAPVIWQDGGYRLGEITLSENDPVW